MVTWRSLSHRESNLVHSLTTRWRWTSSSYWWHIVNLPLLKSNNFLHRMAKQKLRWHTLVGGGDRPEGVGGRGEGGGNVHVLRLIHPLPPPGGGSIWWDWPSRSHCTPSGQYWSAEPSDLQRRWTWGTPAAAPYYIDVCPCVLSITQEVSALMGPLGIFPHLTKSVHHFVELCSVTLLFAVPLCTVSVTLHFEAWLCLPL